MSLKVYILRGLPASGKTWRSKELVRTENIKGHTVKRFNRDDLRGMVNCELPFQHRREDFINRIKYVLMREALAEGFSVVNDDTNLGDITWAKDLAKEFNAEFVEIDLRDVPLETCIARDKKRPNYVGEDVIKRFYNEYLAKPVVPLIQDKSLPKAIICDLDGTVALLNGRDAYDASTCENDGCNEPVMLVVKTFAAQGYHIAFTSGRKDKDLIPTINWLEKQGFSVSENSPYSWSLMMRATSDNRKDSIVKEEIFDTRIAPKFNVAFVLDDRNQVVEMWRRKGLTCLQVADGNF